MKMKTLDTVVDDIYENLSCLCRNEALEIPEEYIEDFGSRMIEALRHWSVPQESSSSLRMSNIGRPNRRLWYDLKTDTPVYDKTHPSVFIKFLYGHMLEELVLLLVKLAGHEVADEQKEVEVDGVKGHMDCTIDGEVVDIKTASSFAFKKFSEGTLYDDDPFGYIAQLSGYEKAHGTSDGGVLALNKESGLLALYRPGELLKVNVTDKIESVRTNLKSETPPDRCYSDIAEGKSGNRKLARQCTYCPHKEECWSDCNDGKGLRAFKYASGLKYFTKVAVEPRVEEA